MEPSQPQLLHIALDPGDRVYTPDWVAKDMVDFFKPSGRILEPCAGDGVFLKYLPLDTEWCEIERGRDFFACRDRYDYIIGNPPYKIFSKWLHHSFELTDDIIYLIPLRAICQGFATMLDIHTWGAPVHQRVYGSGNSLGFPLGWPCGAIHFQRGYKGGMYTSFYNMV